MHQQNASPPAHRALLVLTPGLLALGTAAALALHAVDVVGTTPVWRVDDVVAVAVVALGALAALWVGLSAAVASLCVLARAAGRTWRAGEHAVERWGPGIVRRALTVLVAAGVGIGAATGAHASAEPAPHPVVADLGWAPTNQAATSTDPVDDATRAATPAAPAVDAPTDRSGADPAAPTTGTGRSTGTSTAAPAPQDRSTPDAPAPARAVGHGSRPAAPTSTTAVTATPDDAAAATTTAAGATTSTVGTTGAPVGPTAAAQGGTVVVRPGDTLWSLTARHLGADATDAAISAEWPRWYAANAAAIGPDPDLLHPGQVLVVPATTDGSTR